MASATVPPWSDGTTDDVAPHRSDRSPWNWLLLIPIVVPLIVPFYNRVEPTLFGWPFFYWMQLLFVLSMSRRRCANFCTSMPIWQKRVHSPQPMHLSFALIVIFENHFESSSM